jgi:membrane protease YdiL (CAAX protease family)
MRSPTPPSPHPGDNPALRPLAVFAAVAVPTGWVLLGSAQLLGLPDAPFVLLTTLLGLLVPAVVLMRRDPMTRARDVLRDCFRPASPAMLMLPALVGIPLLTAAGASALGAAEEIDTDLLVGLGINIVSSVLIINLWEELAWTGFFQRRAMARWGFVQGSLITAVLFAAIHLPLAFDGADGPGQVLTYVGYMLVAGVGMRLLIAGFDVWSGRSLMTIAVVHASFNAATNVVEPDYDWIRYAVTLALGLSVLLFPGVHRHYRSISDRSGRRRADQINVRAHA